jgi:hypothetical protein
LASTLGAGAASLLTRLGCSLMTGEIQPSAFVAGGEPATPTDLTHRRH